MRKVGEFKEEIKAIGFVQHLLNKRITSLIEEDEGSYAIWVHDEGHVEEAKKIFTELEKNGFEALKNVKVEPKQRSIPTSESEFESHQDRRKTPPGFNKGDSPEKVSYQGYVTRGLLLLCAVIFATGTFQTYNKKDQGQSLASLPPIAKALIIDYPKSDQVLDELIDKYGMEKIKNNTLPSEAAPLIGKFNNYTPWIGMYNILLSPKDAQNRLWHGSLLEDVKRGQVWRLFTPAILHTGLLHLLFNILWLAVLGRMIEFNMGRVRFVLFILLTGVLSNICQYFMTGPYFMGVSGVLSAFIGFIWVRKKIAPWEIYLVGKETLHFFMIFILGFLALQSVAFFLQLFNIYTIPLSIANTGHISGLLFGMLFGRIGIFIKKLK